MCALLVLALLVVAAGCSADKATGPPTISIAIAGVTTTVPAAVYCTDGAPAVRPDSSAIPPVEVKQAQRITVSVPSQIAEQGWSIQVWSATDSDGTLVPGIKLSTLDAGTKRTFDGLTTSDAQPNRIYLIIALAPDPTSKSLDCQQAGGLWPVALVRTPTESDTSTSATPSAPAAASTTP